MVLIKGMRSSKTTLIRLPYHINRSIFQVDYINIMYNLIFSLVIRASRLLPDDPAGRTAFTRDTATPFKIVEDECQEAC